jgi:hypothetical protein
MAMSHVNNGPLGLIGDEQLIPGSNTVCPTGAPYQTVHGQRVCGFAKPPRRLLAPQLYL